MAALIQYANGAPGIKYSLDRLKSTIGRGDEGNDICLPCAYASKHHAIIEVVPSLVGNEAFQFYLQDLGSTNKTYVNDNPVSRVRLEDGDVIRIGKTILKFDASGEVSISEPMAVDLELPSIVDTKKISFSRRLNSFYNE